MYNIRNMKKFILFSSLLFCMYGTVQAQSAPPFWDDITAFNKKDSLQPPPLHEILFVGSSSFTKWTDVADYFPGYAIINRGFGGSTLKDVIRYVYEIVLPYKPKQVVIYCGENDLASPDSITATETVSRFKTLFGMIRQNLPDATIDYVSIKPSPSRAWMQAKAKAANKAISIFLKKQKNAGFIDIYPAMLDANGKMREELYVADRLHMKPEGYRIWQKKIVPYLIKE